MSDSVSNNQPQPDPNAPMQVTIPGKFAVYVRQVMAQHNVTETQVVNMAVLLLAYICEARTFGTNRFFWTSDRVGCDVERAELNWDKVR